MSQSGRQQRPDIVPPETPDGSASAPRRVTEIRGASRRIGPSRFGPAPLHEIGIAGLTRSRILWFVALLMIGWVVAGFIGQAGDTVRATERAATVKADNAALEARVAALREQIALVGESAWVAQQARSYGLGSARETQFILAPDAPPLPADAPGSAERRLGTVHEERPPLESWLELLFGSGVPANDTSQLLASPAPTPGE
jgi:hypothetical protein